MLNSTNMTVMHHPMSLFIITGALFVYLFLNVLVNYKAISRTGPKTERLTILRAATPETELGDHDFCLSRLHYTDTNPTSREQAATAGIEPETPSPTNMTVMHHLMSLFIITGVPRLTSDKDYDFCLS